MFFARLLPMLALGCMLALTALGCAPAGASPDDLATQITAGPAESFAVAAGETAAVQLDQVSVGEPTELMQSDGLIPLAEGPLIISGRIALEGTGTAAIQIGPRGGPWQTISLTSPPIVPGLLVDGPPDHYVRLALASARGARVIGGDPLQTWLTAVSAERQ